MLQLLKSRAKYLRTSTKHLRTTFALVLVIGATCACSKSLVVEVEPSEPNESSEIVTNETKEKSHNRVDASHFIREGLLGQRQEDKALVGQYHGGIVPHHDLAFTMINDFYRQLITTGIDGVILIGPDHKGLGEEVSLATAEFETWDGVVEVHELTQHLMDEAAIGAAPLELQESEHSIGLHMNYISRYIPSVPVTAFYVRDSGGLKKGQDLVKQIIDFVGEGDFLVIASVDFSHFLTVEEADVKDAMTLDYIIGKEYSRLYGLDDAYIDSSSSVFVALTLLEEMGYEEETVLEHSNSGRELKRPNISSSTGYYTIGYE